MPVTVWPLLSPTFFLAVPSPDAGLGPLVRAINACCMRSLEHRPSPTISTDPCVELPRRLSALGNGNRAFALTLVRGAITRCGRQCVIDCAWYDERRIGLRKERQLVL